METIRYCEISEIHKLQKFIHEHWNADHILSKDTELLKFQHLNPITGKINFVVAVSTSGDQSSTPAAALPAAEGEYCATGAGRGSYEFTAILGFIPTYQYDSFLINGSNTPPNPNPDIWLAIWMRSPQASKGIGMKLYDFLVADQNPRSIAAIGINDEIKKRYLSLGFKTGELIHYYHENTTNTKIIGNYEPVGCSEYEVADRPYQSKAAIFHKEIPTKSHDYFIKRYFHHPKYKYRFYTILKNGVEVEMIVVRKIEVNGACCIRIVDVANNFKKIDNYISHIWQKICEQHNAEYIDLLCNLGIYEWRATLAGFKIKYPKKIIPNYFEPFERKNINIEFAYKFFQEQVENYVIYKGDSDQDRPNLIKNGNII